MGKKGDTTRQNIRAVAYDLFANFGYTKVTMQDICEKTGLSKGGLYRHYEDKCKLFTDILHELQKTEEKREENGFKQGLSAIKIFNGYLDHIKQDLNRVFPNINIALYEFCVEHKDGAGAEILSTQFKKGQTLLLSLIEYGISEEVFHLTNPEGAVSTILFLVEGLRMANEVMPIPPETLAEVLGQIKEMVGLNCEE